ncbi:unnamed protein product [Cuscuta epithymum]|uniref:Filament-like plant protein n=1 Tax=Cuscuta epithymum TaxID=186058 RepID=A0AAV0FMG3_9ASTE|nr:unnamed protein product [Cuscuta epithymum]
MEKRKWLWKRKSSEKGSGETESSDEQDTTKESPDHHQEQSSEATSNSASTDDEVQESLKCLTAKLSAALVNVSAKEDLVKQHAKVAEEAVAGWEKAENEVVALKQQLEVAEQQNVQLDGALKECVRQLRNAKDEQEKRIAEAILEKNMEWESSRGALEKELAELRLKAVASEAVYALSDDHDFLQKLSLLEKENENLKLQLLSRTKELEVRTVERDLSTKTAETASKQQLESIKKLAKLEVEYRRLQAQSRKPSISNVNKSCAASTDSRSESGEQLKRGECDPSGSDHWVSALISELDQFKNDESLSKNISALTVEIDIMDDFLEMERLASSLGESNKEAADESPAANGEDASAAESEIMTLRVEKLEQKLETIEAEKIKLEGALHDTQDDLKASQFQLQDAEISLEVLRKELDEANDSKKSLEFQLFGMEVEAQKVSASVDSLKLEFGSEPCSLCEDAKQKCLEFENERKRKSDDVELNHPPGSCSSDKPKVKQEDLAVTAASKLAECQKTIASLGRQLQSLATLEDFLTDARNLQGPSSSRGVSLWKTHSDETFNHKLDSDPLGISDQISTHSMNGNYDESPASSSSSNSSTNHVSNSRGRNGFGKLFSRSKDRTQS